ncbi:N-acetylneuraminate synthase family protein [Bacillus sp. SL00103]
MCDEESADLQSNRSASLNWHPMRSIIWFLLRHTASSKPIIFSTAGATIADVHEAYEAITSEQTIRSPSCIAWQSIQHLELSMNLRVLQTLASAFPEAVIGFSDHSEHPTELLLPL